MMSILFAPIYPEGAFDEDWWWVGLIIFVAFMILVIALWKWMRATGFGKLQGGMNTVEAEMARMVNDDDTQGDETTRNPTDDEVEMAGTKSRASEKDEEIADLKSKLGEMEAELEKLRQQM